jgi:hypothetical protein
VVEFRDLADQVGLPIPEDTTRHRSWRQFERIAGASPRGAFAGGIPFEPAERWPQPELLGVVALAQHYGIKTRLLDWTWKARVAAYFAARDVRLHALGGRLAVWALNTEAIDLQWSSGETAPDVEIVRAPRAPNPNLSAQAGLFTVARHVHENVCLADVIYDTVKARSPMLASTTLVWQLTLPASEACKLTAMLHLEGVHAASVFPGFAGVAEAIREREWVAGHPDSMTGSP